MLKSIRVSSAAISAYAGAHLDAPFSDALLRNLDFFLRLIPNLVQILTIYEQVTEGLQKQDATLDQVIASYFWLLKQMDRLNFNNGVAGDQVAAISASFVSKLRRHTERKFTPFTDAELIAFALNPLHRHLRDEAEDGPRNVIMRESQVLLRNVYQQALAEANQVLDQAPQVAPPQMSFLYSDYALDVAQDPPAQDEVARFLAEPKPAVGQWSALAWWKSNGHRYPVLSPIARRYLCMCPSQAASERDFSLLRLILTHLRQSMSTETLKQLSVVKPLLSELYQRIPRLRSAVNIAADPVRSENAKRKRRQSAEATYAPIRPNPNLQPDDVVHLDLAPENIDALLIEDDDDDGERSSDDDFEQEGGDFQDDDGDSDDDYGGDDHIQPAIIQADLPLAPAARYKPICELHQPIRGEYQYIARFKGLNHPVPPFERLFGSNARFVQNFVKMEEHIDIYYLVTVTQAAKKKYKSSRGLMMELGEIIHIVPGMYPNPPLDWPI